jgi:hypothetical protein
MFCRNCGKELTGALEFCMNCGAKPMAGTSFCPGCGAPTTALTEVCTNCGAQVAKAIKKRTWKPTAAGILCIIAGVLCVIPSIIVGWIYTPIGAALVIVAIVPIVGGIFALRRRIWGLALAGSIFTLLNTVVLGMFGAIVFLAILGAYVDNPSAIPFNATEAEANAIIWSDPLLNALIVGLAILPIFGILAIIFVIKGKREFK